jgi:hypothetical protein
MISSRNGVVGASARFYNYLSDDTDRTIEKLEGLQALLLLLVVSQDLLLLLCFFWSLPEQNYGLCSGL